MKITCPNCMRPVSHSGVPDPGEILICEVCQTEFSPVSTAAETAPAQEQSATILSTAAVSLVIVGIVLGIVIAFGGGNPLLAATVFSSFVTFALIAALFAKLNRIQGLLLRIQAELWKK